MRRRIERLYGLFAVVVLLLLLLAQSWKLEEQIRNLNREVEELREGPEFSPDQSRKIASGLVITVRNIYSPHPHTWPGARLGIPGEARGPSQMIGEQHLAGRWQVFLR